MKKCLDLDLRSVRRYAAGLVFLALMIGFVPPATVGATINVTTPEMVRIGPEQGALTGGEVLTITGTNLNFVNGDLGSAVSVFFGGSLGSGGVPARLLTRSATELTVTVPRGIVVGPADITLVAGNVRVTREAAYRYLQPAITSVAPASGSTAGGRQISITGLGFGFPNDTVIGRSAITSVRVGGNAATSVNRTDPTTITAVVPSGVAGTAAVEVTVATGTGSPIVITAPGAFSYVVSPATPVITSVAPASGPTSGGNNVVVTGSNLRGSNQLPAVITFGGASASFVSMNGDNTQATVVVPPGNAGPVDVVGVTSDGRATLTNAYTYGVAPVISAITPPQGPLPGGTRIVIDGSNFGTTGTPTVIVGGTMAVCVERQSDSRISAVVPDGSLGAADVIVALETGGGSVTSVGGFTYATATNNPTLATVAPARGPVAGGTPITLTGTNFNSADTPSVLVDGDCAKEVTVVSDTQITAVTPPGSSGAASVQITTSTGSVIESASAAKFTYVSITSVSPANGPTTGNTQITISGSGFGSTAPTVTVGTLAATVSSFSDTSIVAVTPPGSAGSRDVVVTPSQAGLPVLSRSGAFRYDNPTVTSVFSSTGVRQGGMTVTVLGTGFGDAGTPAVTFGGLAATNVNRSNSTSLTAVVPAGAALGPVTVTVTPAVGTGTGSLAAGFVYVDTVRTPLISSMSPSRGPNTGGTLATVTGFNFRGSNNVPAIVRFGGIDVVGLAVAANGQSLTFTTPAMSAGSRSLSVTTNEGTAFLFTGFRSVGQPSIGGGGSICDAVNPRGTVNYVNGSNSVTVTGTGFRGDGAGAPTVTVSGVAATVTAATDTAVTFIIPNVAPGSLTIVVTPEDGVPSTISGCITLRKPVTITAVATPASINFGAATAAFSFTTGGLQAGDAVSSVTLTFTGTGATSYGPSTVPPTGGGVYTVTPSNAVFSVGSAVNYSINYVPVTYTIVGRPATVTAENKSIVFGASSPAFTAVATGLQGSDALGTVTYTFSGNGYGPSVTPPTNVGVYTITPAVVSLSTGVLGNYSFTAVTGTFTITRKPITVTAAAKTKVFGEADPALTFTVTDGISLVGSLSRVSGTAVGSYAIQQGGVTNGNNPNYTITYVGADLTITRPTVLVTPLPQTMVYGAISTPQLTYTTTPNVGNVGTLSRMPGETVGTYAITLGGVTNSANFIITFTPDVLFTITPRPITVTAGDKTSVFGAGSLPTNSIGITTGNLKTGDVLGIAAYTYTPASPVNAGTYTITPSAAVISSGRESNYNITYATGTLTITGKPATVTAASFTIEYGATAPTFTASAPDLTSPDALGSVIYRFTGTGYDSTTVPTNVGVYTITPTVSALSPGILSNYAFSAVTGTYTITAKPITVTAGDKTVQFGSSLPANSVTITTGSLVTGDSLTSASYTYSTAPPVNAGSYTITPSSAIISNGRQSNYNITYAPGTLTITQVAVTVTPTSGQSKEFDDADPTLTYTTSPTVVLIGALTRVSGGGVGTYVIEQGTVTSTANYTITFTAGVTFEITRKPVTVTAEVKTKVFGESDPALTFTTSPSGIALNGALDRVSGSNVGSYAIGQGMVNNAGNSNYNITSFTSANLTITPAPAQVALVANQSKIYGEGEPTFTASVTGLLDGNSVNAGSVTYSYSGNGYGPSATPPTNVGVYTVTPTVASLVSPGVVGNYSFTATPGTFTITKKPITVTPDSSKFKVFDGSPINAASLTFTTPAGTLVGSDTLTGVLFADGINVGTHSIVKAAGADAANPNYNITVVTGVVFEIMRPTVVLTPTAGQSKVYGNADPVLAYTTAPNIGDVGPLSRVAGETVGTYTINLGAVTDSANFIISFTPGVTFEITARPITVTAASHTIDFGQATPANTVTPIGGLATGDSITDATYTYSPTPPVNAGTYSITPSAVVIAGGDASNYNISYAPGTLTINRLTVPVTATSVSVPFGVDPVFTASAPTLVGSDALNAVTYTFSVGGATPPTAVGTYSITPAVVSLAPGALDNYTFTAVPGTFTVLPTRVGGLFPNRGIYLGGTAFTITGAGFGPPGGPLPTVTFGGLPATDIVLVNNRMLTGMTPPTTSATPPAEEVVDVVVTVTGGGTVTLPLAFTYLPPRPTPVMMTLFPPVGPTAGGTELTITGEYLGGSNQVPPVVLVNGSAALAVTVSEDGSVVSVMTPPGPEGSARDVELFTNEGAAGFVSAFTYIPPIPPVLPPEVPGQVRQPIATVPPVTVPSPVVPNTPPQGVVPNTPPQGVEPVRVITADGGTELPQMSPGESLALDDGIPIPVSVTVEDTTDLVVSGQDWQLRLKGDCSVRVCTIENQNGREVLELEVDGAAVIGGFGFMPGTLVHIWLFSDPIYLGSLLVAADGTYSGPVDLIGVAEGEHTLQVNGTSFDGKNRTANLGVIVRVPPESGARLPSTGSNGVNPILLLALTMTVLGSMLLSHRARRRLS